MTNFRDPRYVFFSLALAAAMGACGNDDDDDDGGVSGRAGSSTAGKSGSVGVGGGVSEDGGTGNVTSPDGGEPTSSGGASLGGAGGDAQAGTAGQATAGEGGEGGQDGQDGGATLNLSDAQVLLVLDTLNQGEVEVAYAALPRLADGDVQAFAQLMVTDHSAARQSVFMVADSLDLAPLPSDVQAMLKEKAEATVQAFHASEAEALDEPYVESQVADHAAALTLLEELAATAEAAELKELIATLEASVQVHYDHALELEAALP
jgi:putative membrane protein